MYTFRACLPWYRPVLLAAQPATAPVRIIATWRKRPFSPPSHQVPFCYCPLTKQLSATDGQSARLGLPAWSHWPVAVLRVVATELRRAADWGYLLLHPLAALRELLEPPRVAAEPPLESLSVLATALLDDHAQCLALLRATPARALTAAERAELLAQHERMTWMLRAYFVA